MNSDEFMRQQQAAVERMREMNQRSQFAPSSNGRMPPTPSFVKVTNNSMPKVEKDINIEKNQNQIKKHNSKNQGFLNLEKIPFLDGILKEADTTLIIGLILILMSENSDRILLLALVYILL